MDSRQLEQVTRFIQSWGAKKPGYPYGIMGFWFNKCIEEAKKAEQR